MVMLICPDLDTFFLFFFILPRLLLLNRLTQRNLTLCNCGYQGGLGLAWNRECRDGDLPQTDALNVLSFESF